MQMSGIIAPNDLILANDRIVPLSAQHVGSFIGPADKLCCPLGGGDSGTLTMRDMVADCRHGRGHFADVGITSRYGIAKSGTCRDMAVK
jgi:hypothetical protein